MLFNRPPGYTSPQTNRQTVGGLAVPGSQSNAITPGGNFSSNPFNQNPFNSSSLTPSSAITPSSVPKPPTMTPYFKSGNGNLSSMLRVLLGNTTTGKK